jgi:hypothetical protein
VLDHGRLIDDFRPVAPPPAHVAAAIAGAAEERP